MLLVDEEGTDDDEFLLLAVVETKAEAEGRSVGSLEISRMVFATRWRPSMFAGSERRSET